MALERCTECNQLGGHLDGCSKAPPPSVADEEDNAATRDIVHGALWLIGGIAVTAIGYAAAAANPNGGSYIIASGAMVVGGIRIIRGIVRGYHSRD